MPITQWGRVGTSRLVLAAHRRHVSTLPLPSRGMPASGASPACAARAVPGGFRPRDRVAITLTLACYAAYLVYRLAFTLNPSAPVLAAVVLMAEAHLFVALCGLAYLAAAPPVRRLLPVPDPAMTVDVVVVCRTASRAAVARTLRALAHRRRPGRLFVVDMTSTTAVRDEAGVHGATCVTPGDDDDLPGVWQAVAARSTADALLTLAAGDIPCTSLFSRTLGALADPSIGWIRVAPSAPPRQPVAGPGRWRLERADAERQAVASLILPGLDARGVVPFTREGTVIRIALVADLAADALAGATDARVTGTLLARGWRGAYINAHLISTLEPLAIERLERQRQHRATEALWAAAAMTVAQWHAIDGPQRVGLAVWLGAWTLSLPRLVFCVTPAWMALGGASPARALDAPVVILYAVMALSLAGALATAGRGHGWLLLDEGFSLANGFVTLRGLLASLPVLPHRLRHALHRPRTLPLSLMLLNAGAAVILAARAPHLQATFGPLVHALVTAWAIYNTALLGWFVGASLPAPRQGLVIRDLSLAVTHRDTAPGPVGVLRDLSTEGGALLWPHPLEPGARLDLVAACAHGAAPVALVVTRASGRVDVGRWHAHDCRFADGEAAFDALDTQALDLQLAHANATEASPSRTRWSLRRRLGRAARHRINLPVRVTVGPHTILAVTRDLSATGLSMLTAQPSRVGDQLTLEIAAAEQRWIGLVTVARCERVTDGVDGPVYLWGLRFDALDTQRDIGRFRAWIAA